MQQFIWSKENQALEFVVTQNIHIKFTNIIFAVKWIKQYKYEFIVPLKFCLSRLISKLSSISNLSLLESNAKTLKLSKIMGQSPFLNNSFHKSLSKILKLSCLFHEKTKSISGKQGYCVCKSNIYYILLHQKLIKN